MRTHKGEEREEILKKSTESAVKKRMNVRCFLTLLTFAIESVSDCASEIE